LAAAFFLFFAAILFIAREINFLILVCNKTTKIFIASNSYNYPAYLNIIQYFFEKTVDNFFEKNSERKFLQ